MNSNLKPGTEEELLISSVDLTYTRTVRDGLNGDAVDDYVDKLRAGKKAPAIEVTKDGTKYWATDGGHRVAAARKVGSETILAHIVEGTADDALKAALGANDNNGVRRSNADKRKIGIAALKKYPDKTDGYLAELTGLSRPFISALLKELEGGTSRGTRVSRSGKKYAAKTTSGKKAAGTDASEKTTSAAGELATAPPAEMSNTAATDPDGNLGAAAKNEADSSSGSKKPASWWDFFDGAHACEALLLKAAELADRDAHRLPHKDRLARALREVLEIARSEKDPRLPDLHAPIRESPPASGS